MCVCACPHDGQDETLDMKCLKPQRPLMVAESCEFSKGAVSQAEPPPEKGYSQINSLEDWAAMSEPSSQSAREATCLCEGFLAVVTGDPP